MHDEEFARKLCLDAGIPEECINAEMIEHTEKIMELVGRVTAEMAVKRLLPEIIRDLQASQN